MIEILGLRVYWYGLILGLSILIGLKISGRIQTKPKPVSDWAFWAMVGGGIVGARLYHVADYFSYYKDMPAKFFALNEGGLGIFGAILGAGIGLLAYSLVTRNNFWELADFFSLGAPLAQATGRLGNLINGEIMGKNGEPLFLFEACLNFLLFWGLVYLSKRKHAKGVVLGFYAVGYGLIRISLESFRNPSDAWIIGGVDMAYVFGLILAVFGGSVIFFRRYKR